MGEPTVIVALPAVGEQVHKITSEKVAHMTLLFLGEVDLSAEAVLYVQHACANFAPSGMVVDYRGTLGEDDADVLFFEKNRYSNADDFKALRHELLLNDEIKRAYDAVEQFPEWTPHLTLGYPESPAKPVDEGDLHRYIDFDRIAVWTEDSAGPEFRLNYESSQAEVSMSDTDVADRGADAVAQIFHYGVKGMKWGVRNDKTGLTSRQTKKVEAAREVAARNGRIADGTASRKDKVDQAVIGKGMKGFGGVLSLNKSVAANLQQAYGQKADNIEAKGAAALAKKGNADAYSAWKKDASSPEKANAAFQKAAKDFEPAIDIINNDAAYKGKDLSAPENRQLARDYDATVSTVFNDYLAQASVDLTVNSRGQAYIYEFDRGSGLLRGREYVVKQSDAPELPDYRTTLDDLGQISSIEPVLELKHYGKKGMKWGVTTNPDGTKTVTKMSEGKPQKKPATDVVVTQKKPGKFVTTKGGERQVVTDDAIKAQANRRKAYKSTTDSLTTAELKSTIERMRLEQEYAKLDAKVTRRGRGFVAQMLNSPDGKALTELISGGGNKKKK